MKPNVLYRFFDGEDNLLYVGITGNPQARFGSHSVDKSWFKHVTRSTMEHYASREELEAAEVRAIQSEKPRYNIQYSVVSPPNTINAKPRVRMHASSDANRFQRPDAIARRASRSASEGALQEIEEACAKLPTLLGMRCLDCELILLTLTHDGRVKCAYCQAEWELQVLPMDYQWRISEMEAGRQ